MCGFQCHSSLVSYIFFLSFAKLMRRCSVQHLSRYSNDKHKKSSCIHSIFTYDIFPIHSLLHFEYKIIQGSPDIHALTRNQVIENTLCKHLIDRVLQYCTFTSSILNFIQKQFSNSYLILRTFLPRSFIMVALPLFFGSGLLQFSA